MNIISRILELIEYKNMNKSKFYKETGLSNGFLDKVKDIGSSKIEHILKTYPEVNPEWLITGKGDMIKGFSGGVSSLEDFIAFARDNNDELLKNEDYKLLLTKNIALLELEKQKRGLQEEEEELRKIIKDLPISKKA